MQRSVVIVKKAAQLIPDDLLSKLVGKYQSCAGVAVIEPNSLQVSRLDEPATLEGLQEVQQAMKDKQLIVVLTQAGPDGKELIMPEDLQPFDILKDKDGEPILVAFFDGNFEQFLQDGNTHSCESFAAEHIRKRLERVQKLARGDINLIVEELTAEDYVSDIKTLMIGVRGSITFAAANGSIHTIAVGTDRTQLKQDWGWVSNAEDFIKAEVKEEPAPKPKGLLAGLGAAKGATKSVLKLPNKAMASDPKPDNVDNPVHVDGNDGKDNPQSSPLTPADAIPNTTGVHAVKLSDGKVIHVVVNGGMKGKVGEFCLVPIPGDKNGKERQKMVKRLAEDLDTSKVKGMHMATHIYAKKSKASGYHDQRIVRSLIELGPAIAAKTDTVIPADKTGTGKVVEPGTNKEGPQLSSGSKLLKKEHGYPERAKDTDPKQVSTDTLPVLSSKDRADIKLMLDDPKIKQAVDRHSQIILDPTKFKELETEVASFQEQMGWKDTNELRSWPFAIVLSFIEKWPKAAAIALFSSVIREQKLEMELHAAEQLLNEADKADTSGNGIVKDSPQPMTTKQASSKLLSGLNRKRA